MLLLQRLTTPVPLLLIPVYLLSVTSVLYCNVKPSYFFQYNFLMNTVLQFLLTEECITYFYWFVLPLTITHYLFQLMNYESVSFNLSATK